MTVLDEKEDDLPTDEEVMAELSSAFEGQLQVKPPPSPSLASSKNTPHTYEDWKLEVDRGLVLRLLDSKGAGASIREDEFRTELEEFFEQEHAYELIADCIVSRSSSSSSATAQTNGDDPLANNSDGMIGIQRSFHAMNFLCNDLARQEQLQQQQSQMIGSNCLITTTRAGLLAKKLFSSFSGKEDAGLCCMAHVNKMLLTLLSVHASAVVSSACAGGKDGIVHNLQPMLQLDEEASIVTFAQIVSWGCTGRRLTAGPGMINFGMMKPTVPTQMNPNGGSHHHTVSVVSKGHRRKFIKSCYDWGLWANLIHSIVSPPTLSHAEDSCDALLSLIDSIGYHHNTNETNPAQPSPATEVEESVGEEILLSSLGEDAVVNELIALACEGSMDTSTTASRALVGIWELATGLSKQKAQAPPSLDETEQQTEAEKEAGKLATDDDDDTLEGANNKLRRSGTTDKLYHVLISHLPQLIEGLDVHSSSILPLVNYPKDSVDVTEVTQDETKSVIYNDSRPVRHPGRCVIQKPFTSRRLNLIRLLTDIISYSNNKTAEEPAADAKKKKHKTKGNSDDPPQPSTKVALDHLMNLSMSTELLNTKANQNKNATTNTNVSSNSVDVGKEIENPWPALVELLFIYPENNMYQIQFYRMLHAALKANHETTLKLVIQKCKFVSRAITGQGRTQLGGVLLRCLNALRLWRDSLPPHAFLRHYLDSHDGWKSNLDTLRQITVKQQKPGGGIMVPVHPGSISGEKLATIQKSNNGEADIELGSSFASDLGFDGVMPFVESDQASVATEASTLTPSPKKKKKKNKKKKKKKETSGTNIAEDDEEEDGNETD